MFWYTSILSIFEIKQMVILYRDPEGKRIFKSTDIDSCPHITSTTGLTSASATTSAQGLTLDEPLASSKATFTSWSPTF